MKTSLSTWIIGLAMSGFTLPICAQKHILPSQLIAEKQAQAAQLDPNDRPQVFKFPKANKSTQSFQTPWLPGEFEETEAVIIAWEPGPGGRIDTTSALAVISSKLCIGIQPEAKVLIRVDRASDTILVKRYMARINEPLYNYAFIVKYGDAWWTRDFGPIAYYTGDADSLVYADFKYYPGRDHDNVIPATSSYLKNRGHELTRMNFEGGNLITDGFGTVHYSSVVATDNSASGTHFPTMPVAAIADSMGRVLKANEIVQIPRLGCDGGTGHLDLYLKMMDEETWIAGLYPEVITSPDRALVENNVNFLRGKQSVYGRPYRVLRVPIPTDNNGTWNLQRTCSGLNNYGRSFVNGITVNKTFIYPIWDSPQSGNRAQRLALEEDMRKWFPGMKLFGIDVRAMLGFGGQLHCITMQIPAENPIKFWHPAYRDVQALRTSYPILAQIYNKSGIATAKCTWRKKDDTGTWRPIDLTDSSGYFIGALEGIDFAFGDTIQYFLEATSNNGKTGYKPIAAPEGYYEFVIQRPTQLADNSWHPRIQLFPNPAENEMNIQLPDGEKYFLSVFDFSGKLRLEKIIESSQSLNLAQYPAGLYHFVLSSHGRKVFTKTILKK